MARVLIADKCADTVESLAMLLRFWGHEAHVACDGPAVLAEVGRFRPHLVLMDIALPKMAGYKVARRLREQPSLRGLSLVALTGLDGAVYRRTAYDAGFDFYLVKPVAPEELRILLEAYEDEVPVPALSGVGVS